MNITNLLRELELPASVVCLLENRRHLFSAYQDLIEGLTESAAAASYQALEKALGEDDMAMLACQLYAALQTREKYYALGISNEIFLDTMGCFRRFLLETERRTNKLCFDRGWWTYRQLSLKLFRIGQLEYELLQQPHAVSLHIPSDACITPEEVDRSLTAARAFLCRYFPDYAEAPIGCESWLLSPALREHLGSDSRIRAFQDRFLLLHTDPEPKDVWEWLFAAPLDTPVEELPEQTSLQRSVKQHLRAGGSIGVARGVIK